MVDLSARVKALVYTFKVINFDTNITTILSVKYKTICEKKMMKFVIAFTTCLAFHLCHETELFIMAVLYCRVVLQLLVVLHLQLVSLIIRKTSTLCIRIIIMLFLV